MKPLKEDIQYIVHRLVGCDCKHCPYDYSHGHRVGCVTVKKNLTVEQQLKYLFSVLLNPPCKLDFGWLDMFLREHENVKSKKEYMEQFCVCPSKVE